MKRLLVSLVIDRKGSNKVSAIVIDVPDSYDPMNDSSDSENPFPELRGWIYDNISSKSGLTDEHVKAYKPTSTFITGITNLGVIGSKSDGVNSAVGNAVAKMIGDSI